MSNAPLASTMLFFRRYRTIILCLILTAVATLPRLYNLGDLSFYMDEETTAFASRSMANGNVPQMPSGMPYYRSLPHTWLNSISINIFGADREYSYRLPGAILGILTIPLLFLLARPYVGVTVAFIAALILALSEWHIITSRQARMYAPFLFSYVACTFAILKWCQKDSLLYLILSSLLFILSASFHNLGVLLAFIPLIALFINDFAKTPAYKLILFSLISGLISYLYGQIFVHAPYLEWTATRTIATDQSSAGYQLIGFVKDNLYVLLLGSAGGILGVWLGICSRYTDLNNGNYFRYLSRYILAILFGCLATTGNLHGAFISIILLSILYQDSLLDLLKKSYIPIALISTIAVITSLYVIFDLGLVSGFKRLLIFPYPNWITLNTISPGINIIFFCLVLFLSVTRNRTFYTNITVISIIAILPIIIVGLLKKWAPARYLLVAYPFILICTVFALHEISLYFARKYSLTNKIAFRATALICISGILGGHGIFQAYSAGTVDHGTKLNSAALIFPFYPDHKNPGEYVYRNRRDGDIIIAEDALQQRWYAGKVDYWLRMYGSDTGGRFLFKGKDQKLHDIYVNSIVATEEILDTLVKDKNHRIWLITSGETHNKREHYLLPDQRIWIEDIEDSLTPVFIGEDDHTKVYCLNCDNHKKGQS